MTKMTFAPRTIFHLACWRMEAQGNGLFVQYRELCYLFLASPRIEYATKPNYMSWKRYNMLHSPSEA